MTAAVAGLLAAIAVLLVFPTPRSLGAAMARFDTGEAPTVSRSLAERMGPLVHRFRPRKRHDAARAAAVELVAAFSSELRAGQPVRTALTRAAESSPIPIAERAVAVATLGGDVPAALEAEAERERLPTLRALAALWRVAEGSGAGLSRACERLAISASDGEKVRAELASQLAGPRATARVLAGLPIFGILLGNGLGTSPLEWLLGTQWGLIVLVAGVGLEVVGLWWIARLTSSVEDRA